MNALPLLPLLLLAASLELDASAGTPRIEFERTEWNFGKWKSEATSATNSFAFRNAGDGTLEIGELASSCGCLTASVEPRRFEPGERGEVNFILTMPSARSTFTRHIVVPSNDPANPKATLSVKADFVPIFEMVPIILKVEAQAGQATNLSVVVRRTDGKPLNLERIEPSKPWVKARVKDSSGPGTTNATVLVEVKPDGPNRVLTEWVRFFVRGSEEPVLSTLIIGRIIGEAGNTPGKNPSERGIPNR